MKISWHFFITYLSSSYLWPIMYSAKPLSPAVSPQELDSIEMAIAKLMNKTHFSLATGNDLITPRPEFNFPGLKPGDKWCICLTRWLHAYQENKAPGVLLEATHEKTLELISLEELVKFAVKN